MQKINNLNKKEPALKKELESKNNSIQEFVHNFSNEKYIVQKTLEDKKRFKKQLIVLIFIIIFTILSIIGASFAIYYAYTSSGKVANRINQNSHILDSKKVIKINSKFITLF